MTDWHLQVVFHRHYSCWLGVQCQQDWTGWMLQTTCKWHMWGALHARYGVAKYLETSKPSPNLLVSFNYLTHYDEFKLIFVFLFSETWEEQLEQDAVIDPRPEPHYEVTFRERVTPSNVYLPVCALLKVLVKQWKVRTDYDCASNDSCKCFR